MKLESLIGQTFFERELFDLLQMDIESNFARLGELQCHVYFERADEGKIRVTEIKNFANGDEMNICEKAIIEKREWFELCRVGNHYCLLLVRFDRTGWLAGIYHDSIRIQEWELGWADEFPRVESMTEEEIRLGFMELAGLIESVPDSPTAKPKRSVA